MHDPALLIKKGRIKTNARMANQPLSGFTRLSDLISIHRPSASSHSPQQSQQPTIPDLIILCSWVNASPKHITKYTSTHRRLFPNATILLIQSTVSGMVVEPDLDAAYEVLAPTIKEKSKAAAAALEGPKGSQGTQQGTKVLLHAFSNGGARSASLLCSAFQGYECPFDAMVLDCCPGTADLSSTAKAISISLPGWHVLQSVNYLVIYLVAVVFMLIAKVLRWEDGISLLRRRLNDSGLVPLGVPRLYMYSKNDELVAARDVRAHAQEARAKGYEIVREEIFAGARHVALIAEDGERYWDGILELVRRMR